MPLKESADHASASNDLCLRPVMAQRYTDVRAHSLALTAGLSAEDQCIQSMPDASPIKWHLAHTSWFFEAVVLRPYANNYRPFDRRFDYLFNSYYESLGPRHARPQRGLLSRPSLAEIHQYRNHVDAAMHSLMAQTDNRTWASVTALLVLGLNHEQQHQELMLTDMLHALSCNPLLPACQATDSSASPLTATPCDLNWLRLNGGATWIGHTGDPFAFDNESPRHQVLLQPFQIADRLVTCGEYAAFIADGGYRRAEFWLSDAWMRVQAETWTAPAYWIEPGDPRAPADKWQVFGLQGVRVLDPAAPVIHLSFYEAAAYAEWANARLPTEFEWESAFGTAGIRQMSDQAWQWTRSSYDPYPGFRPMSGVVREYNGKFMIGQLVLRGGSMATPPGHSRQTYRNFFPPAARWQFSGLRLARDA
jgi:ergothioneine biosynthesis protein EgtB